MAGLQDLVGDPNAAAAMQAQQEQMLQHDPNQPTGDPNSAALKEEFLKKIANYRSMVQQAAADTGFQLTDNEKNQINRASGNYTSFGEDINPVIEGSSDASNKARNEARIARDKELADSDPFVRSAIENFSREQMREAGLDVDEEVLKSTVSEALKSGTADIAKISKMVGQKTLDLKIEGLSKTRDILKMESDIASTREGMKESEPELEADYGSYEKLDKVARRGVVKEIVELESGLRSMGRITNMFDEKFFTQIQRTGGKIAALGEKVGLSTEGSRTLLRKRRVYSQMIESTFQKYRKLITGAQASVEELEQLKKATINGDLSPSEAVGAMAGLKAEMQLEIMAKKQLLTRGIGLNSFGADSDSYRNALDTELQKMAEQNPKIKVMLDQANRGREIRRSLLEDDSQEGRRISGSAMGDLDARIAELEAKQ